MNEQDLLELQLEQELRSMFQVDTQNYLQKYLDLSQQLQDETWQNDIQEMYRSIHTIKGGAVTVGADAILYVATALEDVLSDLRYLYPPPPLADGNLAQLLSEMGELLAGSILIDVPEEEILTTINPTVERIKTIHEDIKQLYLPNWNEQSLLHQEFAEQGFDLVVLDLQIALENLTTKSEIPLTTIELASNTLTQLKQIGTDLELAEGWHQLLSRGENLLKNLESEQWVEKWFSLFDDLKNCAKNSGNILEQSSTKPDSQTNIVKQQEEYDYPIGEEIATDDFSDLNDLIPDELLTSSSEVINEQIATDDFSDLNDLIPDELLTSSSEVINEQIATDDFSDLNDLIPDELVEESQDVSQDDSWEFEEAIAKKKLIANQAKSTQIFNLQEKTKKSEIKISVPLSRLDRTAQNLVETVLAARASQGIYSLLKSQLNQLFILSQENVKLIANLRQIQNEYANLDYLQSNNNDTSGDGLNLEKYRQGYTTINRLLETSLRLSELGAEVTEVANQTGNSLQNLDRQIIRLQSSIEESRLLPFDNLAFRARAIIRDLTNRFNKTVHLEIEGNKIEVDAGTISQLEPILLHLLRNAFDHGIESAEIRKNQGKPTYGTIKLSLKRKGKSLLLTVEDDGGGINCSKISEIARSKNLPLTETTTNSELLVVLSQPGFTSQTEVSDISGRGVGMDVVAFQVSKLGGKLRLETTQGKGTTFIIEIPPPELLVPSILVRSGERIFAIPTEEIATTTIISNLNIVPLNHSNYIYTEVIEGENGPIPVFNLFNYWTDNSHSDSKEIINPQINPFGLAIYVKSPKLDRGIWLLADDLLEQRELVINSLPSPLKTPLGMMGLTLDLDGSLIPVLEPSSLAEFILTHPEKSPFVKKSSVQKLDTTPKTAQPKSPTRTILIVDDAALMRRRLEVSLRAYGYNVHACVDGLDAWTWLQGNDPPNLLITDIEMPEMDGFTLINRCRNSGLTIPILVISSRLSEEWGKEARRLGATDYLTKGFATPDLIKKVSELLNLAVAEK